MEFLIELLFEIILDGSIELGSCKKVPMPIRIFLAIFILVLYLGLGGFFIYIAYTKLAGTFQIFMYIIGTLIFLGAIYVIYKMFKRKQEN